MHDHPHEHDHSTRNLWLVFILSGLYLIAEILGGIWTGSLALLADAGHMTIDTAAIGLGLFARWVAHKPPSAQKTFGYHRAEVLAALLNGALLSGISLWILWEAWSRFNEPTEVKGLGLIVIAAGGLVVNLIGMKLLHAHSHGNLNMRGVWLHLLSDALGSAAAIIAGVGVWQFGWLWIDPVASIFLAVLVFYGAWRLVGESVHVLLEGVPKGMDLVQIRRAMQTVSGVIEVCDLHIWTVKSGVYALSAHVVVQELGDGSRILREMNRILDAEFDIRHSTLQLELHDLGPAEKAHEHCGIGHNH